MLDWMSHHFKRKDHRMIAAAEKCVEFFCMHGWWWGWYTTIHNIESYGLKSKIVWDQRLLPVYLIWLTIVVKHSTNQIGYQ